MNRKNVPIKKATSVVKAKMKPSLSVKIPSKNILTKNPNTKKVKTDLLGKIVNAGISAADTLISVVENPVDGILNKLPNTILKVADAMGGNKISLDPTTKDVQNNILINGPITDQSKESKMIDALKKQIPTVQLSNIPTAFAADYQAPPITITEVKYNGKPAVRVAGSCLFTASVFGNTGLAPIQRRFLNPGVLGGQISTEASLYQKHQWMNVGIFYIPTCATTTNGNIILTWQNSPNFGYTPTTDINLLSQRSHFMMTSCYKGASLPLIADHKQLYNWYSGATSDDKFYSDWSFELWYLNCDAAINLGQWGLTYDILFFSRIEDPTITFQHYGKNFFSQWSILSGFSADVLLNVSRRLVESQGEVKPLLLNCTSMDVTGNALIPVFETIGWKKEEMQEIGHPKWVALDALSNCFVMRNSDLKLVAWTRKGNNLLQFIKFVIDHADADIDPELEENLLF